MAIDYQVSRPEGSSNRSPDMAQKLRQYILWALLFGSLSAVVVLIVGFRRVQEQYRAEAASNRLLRLQVDSLRALVGPDSTVVYVRFRTPREGEIVSHFMEVSYEVLAELPTGYLPVLVVRDRLGQYWSWGVATDGRYPTVQLGTAGDAGATFELGLLITREPLPPGLIGPGIPVGLAYESITVQRRSGA